MTGPPIVLIYCDQLRADAIDVMPNVLRLCERAVRYETCVTNAPLCRPARATLLTGQHVREHGVSTNLGMPAPDAMRSHVRRMRDEAGYRTMVVGKTHLHDGTGHLEDHVGVLHRFGYEVAIELPDAQQHRIESAYSDWLGPDRFRRWRDFVEHHTVGSLPGDTPWHLLEDEHLDTFCARTAAEALDRQDANQPLYLQVCFPGPHPPFDPPAIADFGLPAPIVGRRSGPISALERRYRRRQRGVGKDGFEWLRRAYFGKVQLLDRCIATVLEAVPDDAWIILTSDHGELLGDRGLFGKVLPLESAIRVPLILRPPGGQDASVERTTVDHVDLVEMILAIGGLGEWPPAAHGTKEVRFSAMGYTAVRAERFTMAWDRSGAIELFDRTDPLTNLAADPAWQELLEAHREA